MNYFVEEGVLEFIQQDCGHIDTKKSILTLKNVVLRPTVRTRKSQK